MEKVRLSNGELFDITTNGVRSTSEKLTIAIVAPDTDLVTMEEKVANTDNVARIELLSESEEVLKIYSGYTILTSIEKRKDVVISVTIEEPTDETEEATEVINRSDVIYITLRKANETEARLTSLEETVDVLLLESLGM